MFSVQLRKSGRQFVAAVHLQLDESIEQRGIGRAETAVTAVARARRDAIELEAFLGTDDVATRRAILEASVQAR